MQDLKTKQLIERANKRDPDAFARLVNLYMKDMYRTAAAILRNDENAADAIQDTILVCWEKLETLKKPEYFRTWLIRILINKCYDIRKLYSGMIGLDEIEEPSREDYYNLELKEAINSLGESCSIVMTLYYGLGYNTNEIAEILGISPGTVRVRLNRGRKKLKEFYDAD